MQFLCFSTTYSGKSFYVTRFPTERMSTMGKKQQYQPVGGEKFETSDAKEVIYVKEFKQADKAGGFRDPKLKEAKNDNPQLP